MTAASHRVLVHAIQSSGSSLLALLLAQAPGSLAVLDLWNPEIAPPLRSADPVIVKTTMGFIDVRVHRRSFAPTRTILHLRHPFDVVASLSRKSYRDYGGTIPEKLRKLERAFERRETYDLVVTYEQLVANPRSVAEAVTRIGHRLPPDAGRFPRTVDDVVAHACEADEWCRRSFRIRWGIGNIHRARLGRLEQVSTSRCPEARVLTEACCPSVLEHYRATGLAA